MRRGRSAIPVAPGRVVVVEWVTAAVPVAD